MKNTAVPGLKEIGLFRSHVRFMRKGQTLKEPFERKKSQLLTGSAKEESDAKKTVYIDRIHGIL